MAQESEVGISVGGAQVQLSSDFVRLRGAVYEKHLKLKVK